MEKNIITTMGILIALDRVLEANGILKKTKAYNDSVELFAEVMGETLAKIELNKIKADFEKIQAEMPLTNDSCPICHCIYDDKQKGAQGRNGACECSCGHKSPGVK